MSRAEIILQLVGIFRRFGYEGATLSKIASETGLSKASLYHHFPSGKEEMAKAVLSHLNQWRNERIFSVLKGESPPIIRLNAMAQALQSAYERGKQPCLLAIFSMGESHDSLSAMIQPAFNELIQAIASVLREAGQSKKLARTRAEDAVLKIQGALILSRALESITPFQRVVSELPSDMLRPER